MNATKRKSAKEIEDMYIQIYHDLFDSFRRDEIKYVYLLWEYMLAFLEFKMLTTPQSNQADLDNADSPRNDKVHSWAIGNLTCGRQTFGLTSTNTNP